MGLFDEDAVTELTEEHQKVVKILERAGISLMEEVRFPPYVVDIYIPDYHIAVEVDGPFHEVKKDMKRDNRLLDEYNLPVIRFTLEEARKKHFVKGIVEEAIREWEDSALIRFDLVKDKLPHL